MNVAAKCREEKNTHPDRFCRDRKCLWRTADDFCPRHKTAAPTPTGKPAVSPEALAYQNTKDSGDYEEIDMSDMDEDSRELAMSNPQRMVRRSSRDAWNRGDSD